MNIFLLLGSILMFIGVGMGAFGAHSLAGFLAEVGREGTFDTAVRYMVYHGLALVAVGILSQINSTSILNWAGWAFFIGSLIFSGSLYILIFAGIRWMGAITPIGGVLFLTGWACLAIYAFQNG
ncbi:MAG: DUF423 domain-containing protein [Anaerolineae bacterium]